MIRKLVLFILAGMVFSLFQPVSLCAQESQESQESQENRETKETRSPLATGETLAGEVLADRNSLLDGYITEGLNNNLALKQKEQNYLNSQNALREARSLFYPDLSLNARYTVAEGGRIIRFPVGDMMNPVYNTLNLLTASNLFREIPNQEFAFYRPTEHETKLSLVQPVFDPKIWYNHKIRKELVSAQKADADTYRRMLVAEIKTAYFNHLKTLKLAELVGDTRLLLEENLRVSESLFKNEKATIDNVYRSRAELSKLDQQAAEVEKSQQVAAAYFNFLLNRPLETGIQTGEAFDTMAVSLDMQAAGDAALTNREELRMLDEYSDAASQNISLNQSGMLPSIYAAVDYGYQGEEYSFTGEDDYLLASLVLKWNIFHGFQNRAKISQAKVEKDIRETQMDEVKKQIELEVIQAWYELEASAKSIRASTQELQSATSAFRMINKKFAQGQAPLIEYIDARTAMTNANANLIISEYDYQIKYAEFERIAGLYSFDNQDPDQNQ